METLSSPSAQVINLKLSRRAYDFLLTARPVELRQAIAQAGARRSWTLYGVTYCNVDSRLAETLADALPAGLSREVNRFREMAFDRWNADAGQLREQLRIQEGYLAKVLCVQPLPTATAADLWLAIGEVRRLAQEALTNA